VATDVHRAHLDRHAAALVAYRIAAAGVLGTMAGIHLYLWNLGYRSVHMIGILFLLNVIGGGLLGLVVLAAPTRWLWAVSALAALFMLGTLGGLVLSLTVGLFGFQEFSGASLVTTTIYVESAGGVGLAAYAWLGRHEGGRPRP
jgi:hypothetical protein